ncbi:hypothetical protein PATA110616_00375 [Paenibacillus tarimensis]
MTIHQVFLEQDSLIGFFSTEVAPILTIEMEIQFVFRHLTLGGDMNPKEFVLSLIIVPRSQDMH